MALVAPSLLPGRGTEDDHACDGPRDARPGGEGMAARPDSDRALDGGSGTMIPRVHDFGASDRPDAGLPIHPRQAPYADESATADR